MSSKTYQTFNIKKTPQSEPIPGSAQVQNEAGGYTWAVDDWKRLHRFLILGSEGGTYYTNEQKLTKENAEAVLRCVKTDGARTVSTIVEISESGRAPRNDPALFALAMCAGLGDESTRHLALEALPQVARIGTHLFHFASYVEGFRGWGRGLREAIGGWYLGKSEKDLAYQAVKYQQRDGWSHRDLLRLSHPKASGTRNDILHWMVKGWPDVGPEPHPDEALKMIWTFERAKLAKDEREIIDLIETYGLPREAIPTQFLNSRDVWESLLFSMPIGAMVRNLGKMTAVGLLKPLSGAASDVTKALANLDALKKSRIHPMALLIAQKVYEQGHGEKGSLSWEPVGAIVDALDKAFYDAFANVEPTGKNICLAVDASGSMDTLIANMPMTVREAAVAMALVTASTEPNNVILGYTCGTHVFELPITPRQRLSDAMRTLNSRVQGSGTDCALPLAWAAAKNVKVDCFVQYTDNQTWAGNIHPQQALNDYREGWNPGAKMVVCAMTANSSSIGDPGDAGILDCVGFDVNTPAVIEDFIRG